MLAEIKAYEQPITFVSCDTVLVENVQLSTLDQ